MEPAEPTDVYDFLYRDTSRIASFYAQLFGGRLISAEASSQSREATEMNLKGDAKIASAERKKVRDSVVARKEQIDPHDTATVDLIARLIADGKVVGSGSGTTLVRAEGVLLFADSAALRTVTSMDDDFWVASLASTETSAKKAKTLGRSIRTLANSLDIPSLFMLSGTDGKHYIGTVKPAGLEEPIGGLYYKHGSEGLPGVTVVGIRETTVPVVLPESAPFVNATLTFANVLRAMLFPTDAVRLTPLAIYRQL